MDKQDDFRASDVHEAPADDWNYESTDTGSREFLSLQDSGSRSQTDLSYNFGRDRRGGGHWQPRNRGYHHHRYVPPEQFFRYRSPQRSIYQSYQPPSAFSRQANNRFGSASQSQDQGFYRRPRAGRFNQPSRGSGPNHRQEYRNDHTSAFAYFHPSMLEDPWVASRQFSNQNSKREMNTAVEEVSSDDPELQDILKQMQRHQNLDLADQTTTLNPKNYPLHTADPVATQTNPETERIVTGTLTGTES